MELLIDTGALVDVLTTNVFLKNWPNIKINGAKRDIDDLKNVLLLIVGANRERIFEIDKKNLGCLVIVAKPSGAIRPCVDLSKLNENIERKHTCSTY